MGGVADAVELGDVTEEGLRVTADDQVDAVDGLGDRLVILQADMGDHDDLVGTLDLRVSTIFWAVSIIGRNFVSVSGEEISCIFSSTSPKIPTLAIDFLNDIFVNIFTVLQGGATDFTILEANTGKFTRETKS